MRSTEFDIDFSSSDFDPLKVMPISHRLADHPLLSLEALADLALRLPAEQVRFHSASAKIDSNFVTAEKDYPAEIGLRQALASMEQAGSWIALHNVQTDPAYRALLEKVLGEVRSRIDDKDPGMFYPAFWVFIQSPGATTPYHMDHEQNFLMQIRGEKRGMVWDVDQSLSPEAVAEFHARNSRCGAVYRRELDAKARKIALKPGVGIYMPFTSPHAVENGDNVSITISMTYCTKLTRRDETLHRANFFLRKLGIVGRPVGASRWRDTLKYLAFNMYVVIKNGLQGRPGWWPYWAVWFGR